MKKPSWGGNVDQRRLTSTRAPKRMGHGTLREPFYSTDCHFRPGPVSEVGRRASGRASCQGLQLLGSIRGHAFRSTGSSQEPARDPRRPWQLFRDVFYTILDHVRQGAPRHRFRFKNKLLSFGGSTISLCLSLFPWAKFRRTKGAVKLHMLLDHDGYLPDYAYICQWQAS